MLKKVSSVLASALLFCFILTGCYDALEVDDEVYVFSLGVDKGVSNKVRVTIQYPVYKSSSDSGSQGDKSKSSMGGSNVAGDTNISTIDASTILEALDMFGMSISRRVSLMHTKELIFSEEFAREGVGEYLAPMARFRETRRTTNVIITQGKAQDFIKENISNIGDSLAKSLELMMVQSDNTSYFPRVQFHDFYKGMISSFEQSYATYAGINNFDALLPEKAGDTAPLIVDQGFLPGNQPREGVSKREFAGTAVFDGDKMIGVLDSEETRYFLMVAGKFKKGIIVIEDKNAPGDSIPMDLRPGRAPILKGRFENGKPVIDVILKMEADVGAIQSRINYESFNRIKELEQQTADAIKGKVEKVIKKVQKEYKTDIFGFGHKFAGYFPTIQDWEAYDWLTHFQEAVINVTVDVSVRRTGLMIYSSPIKHVRETANAQEGQKP